MRNERYGGRWKHKTQDRKGRTKKNEYGRWAEAEEEKEEEEECGGNRKADTRGEKEYIKEGKSKRKLRNKRWWTKTGIIREGHKKKKKRKIRWRGRWEKRRRRKEKTRREGNEDEEDEGK